VPAAGQPVAVVLAAGQGTRMRSELPKVLHRAAGRPLLAWVLDAARAAGCGRILVVVGHRAEQVRAEIGAADDLDWVVQGRQLGTGHALAQVEERLAGSGPLLVLSGDVPLVGAATLERLLAAAAGGWGAMAVADLPQPGALGRVIARGGRPKARAGGAGDEGTGRRAVPVEEAAAGSGGEGEMLERIVEAAEATPAELELRTVNAGLYALPAPEIFSFLAELEPSNAQGEYYLTDAVTAAAAAGRSVALLRLDDPGEALGVNDRRELAEVHRRLLDRHLDALMSSGVTVLEPGRTVVEATVCVGPDTVLYPGVSLLGRTTVGAGCVLQQGVWVRDSRLGNRVVVEPYSVVDGAEVGDGCQLGPFARLSPASRLLPGARMGSFVENGSGHGSPRPDED
jgi:bifunctional UDP-N-acetylglucosamine pyrophosphorylase/glucosamine-1-phosphate N-acetyltransferase